MCALLSAIPCRSWTFRVAFLDAAGVPPIAVAASSQPPQVVTGLLQMGAWVNRSGLPRDDIINLEKGILELICDSAQQSDSNSLELLSFLEGKYRSTPSECSLPSFRPHSSPT